MSRDIGTVTIAAGASLSEAISLEGTVLLSITMPAAWTAAALTVEVSHDGTTYHGLVYDDLGIQVNVVASPVAGATHEFSAAGMLPFLFARIRSGTTASPVNQVAARTLTFVTRPLA